MASAYPIRPRVTDPAMMAEEPVEKEETEEEHSDSEEEESPKSKKSKVEKVKGLFTSMASNKVIVVVVVLLIIIIGVVAYVVVNRKGSSPPESPKVEKSILTKIKDFATGGKDKSSADDDSESPSGRAPAIEAPKRQNQPPAKPKPQPSVTHDDVMKLSEDEIRNVQMSCAQNAARPKAKPQVAAPPKPTPPPAAVPPAKATWPPAVTPAKVAQAPKTELPEDDDEVNNDLHEQMQASAREPMSKEDIDFDSDIQAAAAANFAAARASENAPIEVIDQNVADETADKSVELPEADEEKEVEQPEVSAVCNKMMANGKYCKRKATRGDKCGLHA